MNFILSERRKTGKTLPIIFSLNERPDKNPKELLNLLREKIFFNDHRNQKNSVLSAATRLSKPKIP